MLLMSLMKTPFCIYVTIKKLLARALQSGRWDAEEEGPMQKLRCAPNFYFKLHRAYISTQGKLPPLDNQNLHCWYFTSHRLQGQRVRFVAKSYCYKNVNKVHFWTFCDAWIPPEARLDWDQVWPLGSWPPSFQSVQTPFPAGIVCKM